MAGRIERVVPGAHAEAALAAAIGRLQGSDRLAPVFVAVRTPTVGLSLRRRLALEGAFASVRFAPLGALVTALGVAEAASGARQPLTKAALRVAARLVLSEAPGLLAPVAGHAATEASLVATFRDLRWAHDDDLGRLSASSGRAHDVVHLIRRMRQLLEGRFYDSADLVRSATERLRRAATGGAIDDLADVGQVVLFLPDPLLPAEIEMLGELASSTDVLVLAARSGDELADRGTSRLCEALVSTGQFVDSAEADSAAPDGCGQSPRAIRFDGMLSAPDDDVEVREAVRRLLARAEAGGDLGRCVVTFPDCRRSEEIGRRVVEQLRDAGIPCSGAPGGRLRDTPHGRLFAGLLTLATPRPAGQELDRGELMGWIGCGPIRAGHGLTRDLASVAAESRVPVGEWDRCSRAAGVLSGIAEWRARLRSYMALPAERFVDGASREATQDLLVFVERLHALVAGLVSARTWVTFQQWADGALEELLEPGDDREALADSLADLDALDAFDPLNQVGPVERLARFAAAVDEVMDRPALERGRFGVGPTVGVLSAVAGISSDMVLVLGCREGDLPSRQPDDPLVPRLEREAIAGLAPRERVDEGARRHLVSLICAGASTQASYARIDVRAGRAVYPSRWTEELFDGRPVEIPSFAGSLRRVAEGVPAADSADFELASLSHPRAGRSLSWLGELDPDYARRRAAISRRTEPGLSRFAGYVVSVTSETDVWDHVQSATSLQSFAKCPFQFFVEKRLGVGRLEAPERLLVIDARERGTLMHDVLEEFFRPLIGRPAAATSLAGDERLRLRQLALAHFARFEAIGKTGKPVFWRAERERILRDLVRFVSLDIERSSAESLVPVAVELDFGSRDEAPLVISVAGREIKFRGRIDRIDAGPAGKLVVADYKSGKADGYKSLDTDPLGRGSRLQLPIYAKAAVQALGLSAGVGTGGGAGADAVPVRSEYRFLQSSADYAVAPVELTSRLDAELSEVLGVLVATIDSGCFPPRPGTPQQGHYENCRYCDFDGLCTTDRADLWQRASVDPRMKAFAELVNGASDPESGNGGNDGHARAGGGVGSAGAGGGVGGAGGGAGGGVGSRVGGLS
ncbi:MAG: PD-(D/E)XK nuclease family protein [Acidimicrobiales bacterium]|jgi:RecB family exonuclease